MKNIWLNSIAAGILTVSTIGAAASAASTWTISTHTVSAHGRWSSFGSPNLKQTHRKIASFNGDILPNTFGYNVKLINSNAKSRSTWSPLIRNKTTYAIEQRQTAKHFYYYADPRSNIWEPNKSLIKLHFSADRK